ncbi:Helix-turn-helix domain [Mycobacteroides abscessus subsp. abscessus]|uniref:helix-turn-helix domain-containing protein n=1 Tax=Mycobacteroides abscessus TaxID=36809 RepID=UPI0009A5A386|nr:helix-turn-helix domain-containing protein [Mycobacteroides abscessus]SKU67194.1 Helix-turn-helix domain [Mycobacteroides abscessus subsp. abscessus]
MTRAATAPTEAGITDFLTPTQVAEALQVSRQTLSYWRARNRGPLSVQVGQAVRYPRAAFNAWVDETTRDTARGDGVKVSA